MKTKQQFILDILATLHFNILAQYQMNLLCVKWYIRPRPSTVSWLCWPLWHAPHKTQCQYINSP